MTIETPSINKSRIVPCELKFPVETENFDMRIIDVTKSPILLNRAMNEVANSYQGFSSKPTSVEEIKSGLLNDRYDFEGRTRWLVTLVNKGNEGEDIAASVRIVFGKSGDLPPIDAMSLVQGPWPHIEKSVPNEKIAEYGRFTIPERWRTRKMKETGMTMKVTKALYKGTLDYLKSENIEFLYAIMPKHVYEFITTIGIKARELEGFIIKPNNDEARRVIEKYDIYWNTLDPRVYNFDL